jgi:predicted translin family RNA/ssDNA-binding protein
MLRVTKEKKYKPILNRVELILKRLEYYEEVYGGAAVGLACQRYAEVRKRKLAEKTERIMEEWKGE